MAWKTGFLVLTLFAIASTNGLLTACYSVSSNENPPNATATDASAMQHTGHDSGMMHHGMAMDNGPADAYYDLRFIDGMRIHHRGAIAMSKVASQKSQRREIKSLARNIIITQNREEQELLQKWRKAWYPQASVEPVTYGGEGKPIVAMTKEQQQSMAMSEDLGSADAKFDLRFMNAMITHHSGAIAMAQDALLKSKRPEIKQLAREIATSQQTEIDQMKQWRNRWYKQ